MYNQSTERKRDWLMQILLCMLGIFTVALIFPTDALYGSMLDWFNQHRAFPEYFRQLFYQTGNLFPDFAWEIGGGQNMYQFTYYGLFSPWLFIFYLLPFLSIETYLPIAAVAMVLFAVCICYRWLRLRGFSLWISFLSAACFLWATPLLFHTHRHIMFMSYFPFLMLAILSIEKLFIAKNEKHLQKRAGIQICIAVFLLILSSYFFAPSCLVVLFIYIAIRAMQKTKGFRTTLNHIAKAYFKIGLYIALAIGMAAFLLIPTAWALLAGRTSDRSEQMTSISSLFIPTWNWEWLLGSAYGLGLTPIILFALVYSFFQKKKEIRFLAIICTVFLVFPFFAWILNGTLYIHEKALIPFLPLWILLLANFLSALVQWGNKNIRLHDKKGLFVLCSLLLLTHTFAIQMVAHKTEEWVARDFVKQLQIPEKEALVQEIQSMDHSFYRLDDFMENTFTINQTYDAYRTSVYASLSSKPYNTFYYDQIENPISARNRTITAASPQIFSQMFLGVKYIFVDNEKMVPVGYQRLELPNHTQNKSSTVQVFQNPDVSSIGYALPKIIKESEVATQATPEKITALFRSIVVSDDTTVETNKAQQSPWFVKMPKKDMETFSRALTEAVQLAKTKKVATEIQLPNVEKDEIVFLTFDISNAHTKATTDIVVTINGIKNKLSKKTAPYPNENYQFVYALSGAAKNWTSLEINLSKGDYEIENINLYQTNYQMLKEAIQNRDSFVVEKLDKKSEQLTGHISVTEDGYFATSLPYQRGFQILVDGKPQTYECVNFSFVGFPIQAGTHQIQISYEAPGKILGGSISILFIFIFFIWLFFGQRIYSFFAPMIKKYQTTLLEIFLYLFFGVLTTAVSFLTFQFSLEILGVSWGIANIISWVCSVIFAYFTNRTWVFQSKQPNWFRECLRFASLRLASLGLEMLCLWILIEWANFSPLYAKIIAAILVVISNYFFSRLFVFRLEKKLKRK